MIILKKSMQKYIIFLTWNDLLSFFLFLIKKIFRWASVFDVECVADSVS